MFRHGKIRNVDQIFSDMNGIFRNVVSKTNRNMIDTFIGTADYLHEFVDKL